MTGEPAPPDRLLDLIDAALALEPSARAAFLEARCGGDAALRAEAESLLRFEQPARDFIEVPAPRLHAAWLHDPVPARLELQPGDTLGEYRIVSLLGEGGMGEVYLAEDAGLGKRKVAVKLVKTGVASGALLRNFQQERLILAGLNHPHIAAIYGGAVTAGGVPYFVMEYVEGERIDTWCDGRRLAVPERLALFRKVCAAVSHAHRHMVVHRDLKPANIRVTPEGEPKLLDFGIAKLLAVSTTTGTAPDPEPTLFAALTPAYASPEQVRGESVTTATDTYGLGVLLYELLCGGRPFETRGRSPADVIRAVCEQAVERPSAALGRADPETRHEAARRRGGVSPARLVRQLRGDLDNIVLTALRKEPERRYESASQLSDDLGRHLDGRPVTARRETWRYVGWKFIRRNKLAAGAAGLLALSLVGGIVATTWQARRAERRFEDVRRLADSLLFEIHDSVRDLPGSTPTRRLIVSRALQYLDGLSREADTPTLRHDLAAAYEKIGDIQGNPYSANLGDTEGALASYRKAEALRESLQGTQTKENRLELGRSDRSMGDILEVKGLFAETVAYYRRSLDIFQGLQRDFPTDFTARDEYARAYETLGDGLDRVRDGHAERLASYEHCLALRQSLLGESPGDPKLRRSVAVTFVKTGLAAMPDKARAVGLIREGGERLRTLSREQPDNARAERELAWAFTTLGNVLTEAGDFAGSLAVRREVLPIREKIAAADPQNKQARFDLVAARADMAEALTGAGDPAGALPYARQCVEGMEALLAGDPTNASFSHNTGFTYDHLARAHEALAVAAHDDAAARREHWTQALASYEKEREIFAGLRERGALRPASAGKIGEAETAAARCRAELSSL